MKLEEILEKIQNELVEIKANTKELNKKIDKVEENLNARIDIVEEKLNGRMDSIENKMDIMANVNIARILENQIEMRKELNNKIDHYILQNNLEHKKFAYQIARLEKENGTLNDTEG